MWVAFAAACIAVSTSPVSHAAGSYRLTVTGDHAGYVDVVLGKGNTFDLAAAKYQGGSKYVGVLFSRLGSPEVEDSIVAIRFPVADPYSPPRPVDLGHTQTGEGGSPMTAGTYRVYLLADGPASVSFPASQLKRNVTLKVTRQTSPRLRVTDIATPLSPGVDGLYRGEARLPASADGQAIAIYRIAAVFPETPVERHGAEVCDVETGGTCSGPTGGSAVVRLQQDEPDKLAITGYVPRDLWDAGDQFDVYGTCYALQPVPTCRLVALDRFVSTAATAVALTLPEPAPRTTSPRSTARPATGGGTMPSTGLPADVAGTASLLVLAAAVLRRRTAR